MAGRTQAGAGHPRKPVGDNGDERMALGSDGAVIDPCRDRQEKRMAAACCLVVSVSTVMS